MGKNLLSKLTRTWDGPVQDKEIIKSWMKTQEGFSTTENDGKERLEDYCISVASFGNTC